MELNAAGSYRDISLGFVHKHVLLLFFNLSLSFVVVSFKSCALSSVLEALPQKSQRN